MESLPTQENQSQASNFRVVDIKLLDGAKATQGFADVRIGQVIIYGFCVIKNRENELFVMPPSRPGKSNGKNYAVVAVDEDFKKPLFRAILKAFDIARKSANEKPGR